jgi:hypothetical protein
MTNIPNDQIKVWIRNTLLLLCLQAAIMIALMTAFIVIQSRTSADRQYVRVTDTLLDMQARMERNEQNEAVLFRMLRNDSDQRGVIPDRNSVYPIPPSPPKPTTNRPGGVMPGDALGDVPEDTPQGDH